MTRQSTLYASRRTAVSPYLRRYLICPGVIASPHKRGRSSTRCSPFPAAAPFLVSAAKDALFLTIGVARSPHRACGPALGWSKHLQKMRSEAHCPGLLTVDYFVAKTQIRVRITHVGSEYRKDITSGTCALCITDWVARSSPSASSRPSKPAHAPPRWSSISTAPTSTMAAGTRSSPDVFLPSRARGGGWPWRARMDREGHAKVRRKLIIQTRPREPDACYANHCFFRVLSLC